MRLHVAALGALLSSSLAACSSDKPAPEETQHASGTATGGSESDQGGSKRDAELAGGADAGRADDAGQRDAAPSGCGCDPATSYCFKSCGSALSCEVFLEGCQPATPACEGHVTCGCLRDAGVIENTGEYPCWVGDGGVVTVAVFE